MKIFLCASRANYDRVGPVRDELERRGHQVTLPNNFDDPGREDAIKSSETGTFVSWKSEMLRLQASKVAANDAVLVLNFERDGHRNHLGGATFLEVFKAWELGKKIYLYNSVPESILRDELTAMSPTILDGDLDRLA
jgi:hypothetical protein